MKGLILILFSVFCLSALTAQVNDHALGVRFGYGGGISYQHGLNKVNRLEANLALGLGSYYSYFKLSGAYHWVFDIGTGFNLYAGPAATVGSVNFESNYFGNDEEGLFIAIGGQLGLDYNFQEFPLQISIDIMPQFPILNPFEDVYFDPAIGVRWVF